MNTPPSNTIKSKYIHQITILVVVVIFFTALYVVHRELSAIHLSDILTVVHSLSALQIGLAFLSSSLSYFFLTQYDRLGVAYLNRSLPYSRISAISFMAFAVGHNVGVSALSGGSIRYRAYSLLGLSATDIATIIAFCTTTFFLGGAFLLGIVLIAEPSSTLLSLGVPIVILKAGGGILLLLPFSYLMLTRRSNRAMTILNIQIEVPKFAMGTQQLLFASLDLLAGATVLYVLLPQQAEYSYLAFVGIYILAIYLGVISNVPGGVGVFEGLLLLLLPNIPKVELIGAILVFRIIYYLIPLGLALVLLAIQEMKVHQPRILSSVRKTKGWVSGIAPQIMGLLVFIEGIILLVSGALPADASRLHVITDFVPLTFLETSHFLNSAVGVGLLVVARGLYQRLRGAYHLSLLLLFAGIITSMGKGLDFEEAIAVVIAVAMLWLCRDEFYRPAAFVDQRFTLGWFMLILSVLASTLWIGLFAHQHEEYNDTLWWKFAVDANAPRMLRGVLSGTLAIAVFSLLRLTRAAPPQPQSMTDEDLAHAKRILLNSTSTTANVVLLRDKRVLFHESGEAFIMYQISGNSWIALGDPVGKLEYFESLLWQFKELAHRQGDRCAFYQVSEKHLSLYVDLGLTLSKLGEEAKVYLPGLSLEGSHQAELRQARNKGIRNGASFEVLPAANLPENVDALERISSQWLMAKQASEKGFSLGMFDPAYLSHFDYAVVRVNGEIVAFANIWSDAPHVELSIDLMRYGNTAPKGVMDYLFVEMMLWGSLQGYQWFSLGMAPLSGLEKHPLATIWHKVGNSIFRLGDNFYNFEGLRSYKEKFNPEWKPLYLAAPGGLALPQVLIDATILISGGLRKVFAK